MKDNPEKVDGTSLSPTTTKRRKKKSKKSKADGEVSRKAERAEVTSKSSRADRRVKEALEHHAVTMEQMCYSRAEVQQLVQQVDSLGAQVAEVNENLMEMVARHAAESSARFDQFDRLYGTAFFQLEQLLRVEVEGIRTTVGQQLQKGLVQQQEALKGLVEVHLGETRGLVHDIAAKQRDQVRSEALVPSHADAVELLEAKLKSVRQDVEAEVMETVTAHLTGASEKISQELMKMINERLGSDKQASRSVSSPPAASAPVADERTSEEESPASVHRAAASDESSCIEEAHSAPC